MRTTVVTGLLGSGKTTFIRNFLKDRNEKAVVLVNDFGQAGIDGEILSAGGIEAIELPSGCVCCTLKFDLIRSMQMAIRTFAPDHLIIEPSGVASPTGVLEAIESAGLEAPSVVGIVDATEFAELYGSGMYGSFFREQIESADAILVNKVDIAGPDAVAAAEQLIGEINPHAVLVRTENAVLSSELYLAQKDRSLQTRESTEATSALSWQQEHCRFETLSFRLRSGVRRERIRWFFEQLTQGAFGTIVRAKALVQTDEGPWRFDSVYGKVDEMRFESAIGDSRLVVIGQGLDEEGIKKACVP